MINTGGEKVHPAEVENALLTHPAVTDCIVVGVPDPTWGERVAALVAMRPDPPVTQEELRDWVRRSLAGYKVPRVVVIVDALNAPCRTHRSTRLAGREPTARNRSRRVSVHIALAACRL
ncbi:AMP-binding enzyme [Frankia sp. Cr2]|uniref:AMP-binding enzyme n=1 Tax=Frankia sp. Cr2 TaxID=3073932 RepID=UPI002AD25BC4|nr:hypothetical protein [Frankia sp. Cr2]